MADSNNDDIEYFRKAMQGVRRIAAPKVHVTTKKIPAKKIVTKPIKHKDVVGALSDHVSSPIASDEKLIFSRSGLQPKFLRELRQGKIKVSANLDLHGMTVNQARVALTKFINTALHQQHRCVQIVHGKGRDIPVLKNQVNTWLKQIDAVLAFCSAMPRNGGAGALYVWLKRDV